MATRRQTYGGDFFVDLGRSEALGVGVLAGGHLEHAHAEGVDVDGLVVVLLVHLGRHELGRADDRLGERAVLQRGQAQVADLDAARRPRDEDVVALWHQTKETTKTNQRTPFFSFSLRRQQGTCRGLTLRSRWMMEGVRECKK